MPCQQEGWSETDRSPLLFLFVKFEATRREIRTPDIRRFQILLFKIYGPKYFTLSYFLNC